MNILFYSCFLFLPKLFLLFFFSTYFIPIYPPAIIQITANVITNFFLIWNLLEFKYNQNISRNELEYMSEFQKEPIATEEDFLKLSDQI